MHVYIASDETDDIVKLSHTTFCKERNEFSISKLDTKCLDLKIDFLELNDVKFVYALTQYS